MGLHKLPDGRYIDPGQIETVTEKGNGDVECIMHSGKKFKVDTMTVDEFIDFVFVAINVTTTGSQNRTFLSPRAPPP